jgi:hypothetical protein
MANTLMQQVAERWVVSSTLPGLFPGHEFTARRIDLTWGGQFAFDAVSEDQSIVVCVSTSSAYTARQKHATAKVQKLKTDALYLLHVANDARKVMVFTERSMFEHFQNCAVKGRFPQSIELYCTPLPADLQVKVEAARNVASVETSPRSNEVGVA